MPITRRPPVQLVPDVVSHDTITAVEQLLKHTKRKDLIGIAYIAIYRGRPRRFIANTTGELHRDPALARGLLGSLSDKLGEMVGSRLVDP